MIDPNRGRPDTDEAARRKGRFLLLMADGIPAADAAKQARIDPWRALKIVTETDFADLLAALRQGIDADQAAQAA